MSVQVTNYQCPACTGPLHFDAKTGQLQCEYCSSMYGVAEIEALYAKKDEQAAANQQAAEEKKAAQSNDEWNTSALESDWGEESENMRAYTCPSCGAELICEATTAATSCPYCDNPTVVPGQFGGVLKPDYVIPFTKEKQEAIKALEEHYKGRPFLPKEFKDENHLQEIKGVYVPFWFFNGTAHGEARFDASNSRTYTSGDYRVTETDHFNVYRAGSVEFARIPVDASKKMPDDYMDSLEPFNYAELKDFSTAYLPGYFADKYDVSVEECSSRADERAQATLAESLESTVSGYDLVTKTSQFIELERGEVQYALLPVWLLNTKWNDQNYLFAMNGQTGKFVGELPVDKKKRRNIFALTYLAAFVVTSAIVLIPGGLLNLLGM